MQLLRRRLQHLQGILLAPPTLRRALGQLHEPHAERRISTVGVADALPGIPVLGEQLELLLDARPHGLVLGVPQNASALHVAERQQVPVAVGLEDGLLDLVQRLDLDPVVHERVQAQQAHDLVERPLVVDPVLNALQRGLRRLCGDVVFQLELLLVVIALNCGLQVARQVNVDLELPTQGLRCLEPLHVLGHLAGLFRVLLCEGTLNRLRLLLQQRAQAIDVQVPDLAEEPIFRREAHLIALLGLPVLEHLLRPSRSAKIGDAVVGNPVDGVDQRLVGELRA
mmetsp:Transcript_28338/g.81435  ORF Transcript_28338/g.81435 Transcript_28338/m.81435 type:complete len:282 (+) Transcript_28338:488-1333(+)